MMKDKSRIQPCIDHINTAVDVDPWAKEMVTEWGKRELKELKNSNQEVKNSNDTISRQAAIDAAIEAVDSWDGCCNIGRQKRIHNAMMQLPPMQPTFTDAEIQKIQDMEQAHLEKDFDLGREDAKPHWIPVTEQLPEDGTWNIFTDGRNISVERYKMDAIDHFFPQGRWFIFDKAIAWIPLPEPYREEGEQDGQT